MKWTGMTREQLADKIRRAKRELETAGPVHKRDLGKHLKRMQAQLRQYDAYQAAARREAG